MTEVTGSVFTMKAIRIHKPGPPEDLQLDTQISIPARSKGEVLVRLQATSINPVDLKLAKLPSFMINKPKIPGGDVAGVVADCDPQSEFRKGDRVFGMGDFYAPIFKAGTYAEWVSIKEKHLALIPDNITFDQAAAVPLVSLTAWQALQPARLQLGQRVLIHAGAGGVGHVAIQLAKDSGAHVTTTCSGSSAQFVKAVGADAIINYRTERFEEVCRHEPFDAIVDTVGGEYEARSLSVLKKGGIYTHIFTQGWVKRHGLGLGMARETFDVAKGLAWSIVTGPRYHVVAVQPDGRTMAAIARLLKDGRLRVAIDRTFPLESASSAQRHVESGHPQGKVVLRIAS